MVVRDHQLEALAWEMRQTQRRELTRRFIDEQGLDAATATPLVAEAFEIAQAIGFAEIDHIYRLAELALLPEYPTPPGRWGALLPHLLNNTLATPEARLAFLDRDLLPRIRDELNEGISENERR